MGSITFFGLEMRPSRFCVRLIFCLVAVTAAQVRGADVTWDNGGGTSKWNTTDVNWSGSAWNNANGDGAIFDGNFTGAVTVNAPINVNSINFMANGNPLSGTGPLTFVNGDSTLNTGF